MHNAAAEDQTPRAKTGQAVVAQPPDRMPRHILARHTAQAPTGTFRTLSAKQLMNFTEEEREQLRQRFPTGQVPIDDGGVARQLAEADFSNVATVDVCSTSWGAQPDPVDPHVWYWCWFSLFLQPTGRGYRFVCLFDWCYNPPVFLFPLGYCSPCPARPPPPTRCAPLNGEGALPPYSPLTAIISSECRQGCNKPACSLSTIILMVHTPFPPPSSPFSLFFLSSTVSLGQYPHAMSHCSRPACRHVVSC